MKKKKIKNLKGMTLVEIIVSLAIFAVISSLLVTACIYVNTSVKRTNKIVNKMNYQTPVAENKINTGADVSDSTIKFRDSTGKSYEVNVKQYNVKSKYTDSTNQAYDDDIASNFKYFVPAP